MLVKAPFWTGSISLLFLPAVVNAACASLDPERRGLRTARPARASCSRPAACREPARRSSRTSTRTTRCTWSRATATSTLRRMMRVRRPQGLREQFQGAALWTRVAAAQLPARWTPGRA